MVSATESVVHVYRDPGEEDHVESVLGIQDARDLPSRRVTCVEQCDEGVEDDDSRDCHKDQQKGVNLNREDEVVGVGATGAGKNEGHKNREERHGDDEEALLLIVKVGVEAGSVCL